MQARTMWILAEEMSDDEGFVMVASLLLAADGLYRWYGPIVTVTSLTRSGRQRFILALSPILCMLMLLPALSALERSSPVTLSKCAAA
jgi:hypothetical protein